MAADTPTPGASTVGSTDLKAASSTGLLTDKSGVTSDRSSALTYKMTPKYADPHAKGAANRMARMFIPTGLKNDIEASFGTATPDGGKFSSDPVIYKLTNEGYFDFFIQSIDESFDDRFQIVETLGDSYAVFGIGKKPRIFTFSGTLLNTVENDWRLSFIYMFQQFIGISNLAKFKGTKAPNVIILRYDSMVCQGAILNLRTSLRADNEIIAPFSFSMLVTKFNFSSGGTPLTSTKALQDSTAVPSATGMNYVTDIDALVGINQGDFDAKTGIDS